MRRKDIRLLKIARQRKSRIQNTPRKARERAGKQTLRAAKAAKAAG
jgi:hypothetical protein